MTDPAVRVHLFVSGRVQGVFFRSSAMETARRLHLAGWVHNLPDGRVEAVFEGAAGAVDAAVEWAREGPPYAHVHDVESSYEEPQGDVGFRIR